MWLRFGLQAVAAYRLYLPASPAPEDGDEDINSTYFSPAG